KLVPKFIGPMKVLHCDSANDTYTLELPEQLRQWCIHPTFHVGLLHKYEQNDDALFPRHDAHAFYDVGMTNKEEWLVDEITAHRWMNNKFLVKWNLGDMTWEPVSNCKELEALNRYLELQGVQDIRQLP
ncbi:hypothetical protein PISMIDRAFT_102827, partial [Pisolithus microcarpus 441]